ARRKGAERRVLQAERATGIVVLADAAREAERPHVIGDDVYLTAEAVAVSIGEVVMAHAGLLADFDEQRLIEPRAAPASLLLVRAERDELRADGVCRHAEDVLPAALEDPRVVAGVVERVAERHRERQHAGPRRVGVE